MTEPSLALQTLVRSRLVASLDLFPLVPASGILDKSDRPEVFPCILIGEGQTLPGSLIDRSDFEAVLDLHLWTREPGLATVKTIAGTVRAALATGPWEIDGFHVADLRITSSRFMRDPAGPYGHAVITVEALMKEAT